MFNEAAFSHCLSSTAACSLVKYRINGFDGAILSPAIVFKSSRSNAWQFIVFLPNHGLLFLLTKNDNIMFAVLTAATKVFFKLEAQFHICFFL